MKQRYIDKSNNTSKIHIDETNTSMPTPGGSLLAGEGYFKGVKALSGYRLEVVMETGSVIRFDFHSRLKTARFGRLKDVELFTSVRTDGSSLIFEKAGKIPVNISAQEFMDLVMIDRTKIGPY